MNEENKDPRNSHPYRDAMDKVAPKQLIPMTKEQVESWIMLKAQTGERWFKVVVLDDEVGQDPTMLALMEIVSDMIFKGDKVKPLFTYA